MIEKTHKKLSVRAQSKLLDVNRNRLEPRSPKRTEEDEVISYDCDLDLGQYIKNTIFDFDAHRRIEHYSLITEQTGIIPQPEN